jgi:hypothetical protein
VPEIVAVVAYEAVALIKSTAAVATIRLIILALVFWIVKNFQNPYKQYPGQLANRLKYFGTGVSQKEIQWMSVKISDSRRGRPAPFPWTHSWSSLASNANKQVRERWISMARLP